MRTPIFLIRPFMPFMPFLPFLRIEALATPRAVGAFTTVAAVLLAALGPVRADDAVPLVQRGATHMAPALPEAPAVDGVVDRRDWIHALKLPPLFDETGDLAAERTEVFIAHTEGRVHVGWRVFRTEGSGPMRLEHDEPGEHSDGVQDDDSIQIQLDPTGEGAQALVFSANAAGAFANVVLHADGTRDRDLALTWDYAARETEFGWEGEASVALDAIGAALDVEPAKVWGFDFARLNRAPSVSVSRLAYRTEPAQLELLSRLRFANDTVAVRIMQAGGIGEHSVGALAAAVNAGVSAAAIEARYTIYRLRDDVAAVRFFDEVDSGLAQLDEMEIDPFADLDRQVATLLQQYERVGEGAVSESVPAGGRAALNFTASDLPVGDYLIAYRVSDDAGRVLAAATLPTRRWGPLELMATPYYATAEQLAVRLRTRSSTVLDAMEEVSFALHVDDHELERALVDSETALKGATLSTERIDADTSYRVSARVFDAAGEQISAVERDLHRPEPPFWLVQEHGKEDFVPPPWEAVRLRGSAVEVWGRTHHFDADVLPSQIDSNGEGLFTAAPRMHMRLDGDRVRWQGSIEVVERADTHVTLRWRGVAGDMPVEARTRIEFDGFATLDLELDPDGRRIDEFHVEFPVRSEWAELYNRNRFPSHVPADDVPHPSGAVGDGFSFGFNLAVWLGNPDRGFQWSAESDQHWYPEDPAHAIEVVPGESPTDATLLRLRVIDRPVELEEPVHYRWGMHATPVRPLRDVHRQMYAAQLGNVTGRVHENEEDARTWAEQLEALGRVGGTHLIIHSGWPNRETDGFGQPFTVDEDNLERIRHGVAMANERDIKTIFYTGWNSLAPQLPWWPYYGEAMRAMIGDSPLRFSHGGYRQCARANYETYLANGTAWMAREIGVHGVFLDGTASAFPCDNALHGCGYVDPETGERRETANIWPTRELFKRMYRILHGEVVDEGVVYSHGGETLQAISSFIDVAHTGEKTDTEELLELDRYRARHYAMLRGVPTEHARGGGDAPGIIEWGVALIHDNVIKMYPASLRPHSYWQRDNYESHRASTIAWRMWWPRQWFDWEADAQWHPYYDNGDVLTVDPESVKASFHRNGAGQVFLFAFNLAPEPREVELAFEVETLGLRSRMHALDVVTDEAWEVNDGRLSFEILGHRPRVIVLDTEPIEAPEIDTTGWWEP